MRHEEVEATNNAAGRVILPDILWRKGRFRTYSAEGSRFVETITTVVAILKPQHRHVLDYLTVACESPLCGESVPSLLPAPDGLQRIVCPAA